MTLFNTNNIIRKVINKLKYWRNPNLLRLNSYLLNSNIILGERSEIKLANIVIFEAEKYYTNIEIGKDCLILGEIQIYNPKSKIKIGDRVFIGPKTILFCQESIEIKNDVMISWGCTLIDTNAHSLKSNERENDVMTWKKGWQYKDWSLVSSAKITVEDKSWIGFNSIILKGVKVGAGSIVGAGSVVSKDVDANSIVGGNPAIFIKKTI
jgi:acetyltransferase-like isoleucine patch superfamily enzyme